MSSAGKPMPRGIRNNNPGNIDRNATSWQGMADDQSSDPRFVVFADPIWGIRALARVLITYQDHHDLHTVAGIINRWAPPVENDTGAYARAVARALGVEVDDPIDVHQYRHLEPLVQAIIRHENGDPAIAGRTRWYPQWQVDEALSRAGVVPAPTARKVALTPETIGSGVAGLTGLTAAGAALTDSATTMRHVSADSIVMTTLAAVMVIAGVALTVYGVIRRSRR